MTHSSIRTASSLHCSRNGNDNRNVQKIGSSAACMAAQPRPLITAPSSNMYAQRLCQLFALLCQRPGAGPTTHVSWPCVGACQHHSWDNQQTARYRYNGAVHAPAVGKQPHHTTVNHAPIRHKNNAAHNQHTATSTVIHQCSLPAENQATHGDMIHPCLQHLTGQDGSFIVSW